MSICVAVKPHTFIVLNTDDGKNQEEQQTDHSNIQDARQCLDQRVNDDLDPRESTGSSQRPYSTLNKISSARTAYVALSRLARLSAL